MAYTKLKLKYLPISLTGAWSEKAGKGKGVGMAMLELTALLETKNI